MPIAEAESGFFSVKGSANLLIGPALAFVAFVSSFGFTAKSVVNCLESIDTRSAALKLLSQEELKKLHSSDFICPTIYTFQRNGKKECLVSDQDGSAFVSCG